MKRHVSHLPVALALSIAACSPALDWRQFTPEDSGIVVVFPCRPDRHARPLQLAGASAPMQMLVCSAGDATYALAFVDVSDPARVAPGLIELRQAALRNIGASTLRVVPFNVQGMTPDAEAVRAAFDGRLPDGRTMHETAAFFAKGMRLYQASVIGASPPDEAIETFLTGFRLP